MKLKLIAVLLAGLYSSAANAMEPFVVKDIRVEGIQRTEAGTVFSYLPVKVGDTMNDEKAAQAIKALFATGFFKDVRLEVENNVLLVTVQERPAISQIDFVGLKEFDKDKLKEGLKQVGLAESRIFDKSLLDRAEQELKRQYFSHGKYAVSITTTVTPLERNRVAIRFDIAEGEVAKIRKINIVGNKAYKESELLDQFVLSSPGWLSWWTKNDQYSKQKLAADLENLRSFYLDRGYLEFDINSTQISITPDKTDIYITINLTEGSRYTISDIKVAGETLIPEAELRSLIKLKVGDVFSRKKLTESNKLIGDRLGNDGYAFANVNAVPELDKEKHLAAFTFLIDPGRRVYVRRINMTGNARTKDEVLRRESRQMEGGWYSTEKIKRTRERLDRLGYFSDVNVETPAVPGSTDQVDVNLNVTEKPTGNVMVGAGFSSSEGIIASGSVSQNNWLGTGKQLSVQLNTSKINTVYALSYTDPYYTVDGVSRGFDFYKRKTNATQLTAIGSYESNSLGGGIRFGVPLNEQDAINFGLNVDDTQLTVTTDSPQRYQDYVAAFGNRNNSVAATLGWARDSRDSLLYPTKGQLHRLSGELALPIGDLKYYKASYQYQMFHPIVNDFVLMLNGELGVAKGYGGKDLPFFKNFYAGGVSSVRGYDTGSIGPKDINGLALGGTRRVVGNAEILFPFPGVKHDKSLRASVFFDGGAIYDQSGSGDGFRYSTGLAINWSSPFGPLKFSFAKPLNSKEGDKLQRFQFQFGSVF
ncbi:MAG: outer membrane protein assembly factor BamA [Burkholderiales bacterium]